MYTPTVVWEFYIGVGKKEIYMDKYGKNSKIDL